MSQRSAWRLALVVAPLAACIGAALPARAADGLSVAANTDLTALSLNELLNIEVTSVSKRAQPLADSAAAVYVLTGEDIRRAGVHSLPEALRLVPGLEVAQADAHNYIITARGFNTFFEDKLLVMIDGRSVYTPLFSGVFWDTPDTYLNDIDRIEVIRGPGAALWGANAVNGVINIITRSAADTKGLVAQASGGNAERVYGAARYGGSLGTGAALRLYAQGYSRANTLLPDGTNERDAMEQQQAGFRGDWSLPGSQALTVSGDAYTGRAQTPPLTATSPAQPATTLSGGNVIGRWSGHSQALFPGGSDWTLQAYYSNSARDYPAGYAESRNTWNVDFQNGFRLPGDQQFLYGLGYRNSHDNTAGPPDVLLFDPPRLTLQTGSAFVQDQIGLGRSLTLTLGSKFELDTFAGFQMQPSARLGWRVNDNSFTWASVSRAVRTPNRLDENAAIYCPPPAGFPGVCGPGLLPVGNPHFRSEELIAYEWGLRLQPSSDLTLDLASFYNQYSKLRSEEATPPPFGSFENKINAHSYGGELSLAWRPVQHLDLRVFYDELHVAARTVDGSTDRTSVPSIDGSDPRHQAGLRLATQPFAHWEFDTELRYVDRLPAVRVPDYTEMGARLAYQPLNSLELALIGQNLLQDRHQEWGAPGAELRRSLMLQLTWRQFNP